MQSKGSAKGDGVHARAVRREMACMQTVEREAREERPSGAAGALERAPPGAARGRDISLTSPGSGADG